ncbi:putative Alpha-2-macroglobulin domain protein [uncultured delta proteobacterium]|uniref:Putative Alpha-2-macroglobulin domain protein n=1 Tax=uncultured delta proteobacterium TaxID=34034 RepID=A0A212IUH6_9DELT|nr:putative Alpha-2-macroglobulin domain protein [uncultured delta proteobacterium]
MRKITRAASFMLPLFLFAALLFLPASATAKGAAPQEAPKQEAKKEEPTTEPKKNLEIRTGFETSGGRAVYRFAFSQPMVDNETVLSGKTLPVEEFPFTITPPLNGEARWLDQSNIAFVSYERLPRATVFTLTPKASLVSLSGGKYTGKPFTTMPYPFYYQANHIRYTADGTVTLQLDFSCKVDLAKLKAALTIVDAKGEKLAVEIEPDKDDPLVTRVKAYVKPEKLGQVTVSLPENFLSEEGPVGLSKQRSSVKVETTSMFAVNTVRARQSSSPPWERFIEIRTTNSADMDKVKQYLDITPATDVSIVAQSDGFLITGDFITRPRVNVTFKKGMPGLVGTLLEDHTTTVVFNDFSPRMAFDGEGTILSPNRSMRLPISSINVEKVQTTLWQLPESNIPLMAMGFFDSYKKHLSRKVAVRTGAVNAVRNRSADFSLDLTQIAGKAKGVFLLTVADASDPKKVRSDDPRDPDDYYYEDYDDDIASPMEKLVVISDIGITARAMPDGLTVWANSIATAGALQNARVRVYSYNNVLVAEGRTDKDGIWRHQRAEDWTAHERPAIIVVSTATTEKQPKAEPGMAEASVADIAFLKLDVDLSADSSFDTGGREYVRQGYEAFCFTPRGIFRPGETVDFKVMVRNSRMQAPEEFPVAWKVRSSTGRTVGSGTAKLNSEGGANFSLPLVPSAPTGRYSMSVSIPGQGKTIGSCTFAVEDFQPPRIEVALSPEKPYSVDGDVEINVDAKYLFGSPVAEAPWEGEITVAPRYFHHPDWRSFYFPSFFSKSMTQVRTESSGTLDADGKTTLTISPEESWTGSVLDVVATVRVREDGGRWVARNVIVPWYKNPFLLGYEYSKEDPQAGAPFSMRLAAVTPDGKPADVEELAVTVERRETYYVRSDRGYTQSTRYVPVAKAGVTLDKGLGTLTFTPPRQATYRIKAAANGVEALEFQIQVWSGLAGTEDGASPLVDRVMLSWERQRYQVGETAMLKVRSPFPGKLLVVLEGETEIYRMVLPLKETETSVPVPVMESMLPNAYCSAWVIRPVQEGERWGAHRAYGIIPMLIDRSKTKLNVALNAPDKVMPKSTVPVSVTLTDANGQPVRGEVTIALVDEGLLSLTNFKTPDPFAFFTAKRAMQGRAYDVYNDLMPLSSRKPITLQPGGGGPGEDGSQLSPMSRKLELLSIFLGSVTTDSNGTAATTLTLPEYSGRGRLMAIAASKTAVGNNDANVRIARDVTVEATVPRMVAPGDVFAMPVIAFGDGKKAIKAKITVETEGPLAVQGEKTFTVALDEKTAKAPLNLTVKALDASGMASVRVITAIEGPDNKPFEQRLEIPVRPPFPRLTRSGGGIIKGGEKAVIDIGSGFFPGTQRVNLSFSDTPGISLMKALDYLGSYPYGCLEQTTSSAWPFLAVPAMLKSIDPEKAKDSEFKQALDYAIRRILSMQRADGGFNGWPGMSISSAYAWTTTYAVHFLTEAKGTGLVPQDALKSALDWMRSYLASSLPEQNWAIMDSLSVKAYVCYVLALNGDAPLGWMQFLKDQGKFLNQSARIFLAGAQALATGKADALRELGTLPFSRPNRYGWSLESSPRNEALRLLMWTHVDPFAPEAALLAKRVMDNGNAGQWRSTQENGMAVMAIGRYIEKTAGPSREFKASLAAATGQGSAMQEIAAFTNKDKPTFSRKNLLPAEPAAPAPLTASIAGEGTAYYSWTTSGVPVEAPAPFAEGIETIRRWVLPDGTVYDFVPDASGKLPEALRNLKIPHGTRVTVTLYVNPKAAMNSMVLADIVPGGFEIDNPNLVPDSEYAARSGTFIDPKTGKPFASPAGYANAYSLNTWVEGRTEMRDDRLLLFVDYMPNRASAFTYTLRAVNKGEFVLPPLSVEDMYDPSIHALSHTARVTVE